MGTPAQRMVAEQLGPHGVTDERVLRAMAEVPREEILAPSMRRHAYEDRAPAIECGQTIPQPLPVAPLPPALRGGSLGRYPPSRRGGAAWSAPGPLPPTSRKIFALTCAAAPTSSSGRSSRSCSCPFVPARGWAKRAATAKGWLSFGTYLSGLAASAGSRPPPPSRWRRS